MQLPPFDKTKPFFPLVMNFAVQMIGFKETMTMADILIIRTLTKKIVDASHLEAVPFQLTVSPHVTLDGYDLAYPFRNEFREMLVQNPNLPLDRLLTHTAPFEIVGPRPLKCLTQEDGLEFSAEEIASVYLAGPENQVKASGVSSGSLLIAAYQSAKSMSDRGPIWEFFRHCRNAAAHGGRFNFTPAEPSRPATWRTLSVHRRLQGTPLFDILGEKGLIALGDSVLLLWEIEQLCP
jgi:hypothetical protein